MKKGIPILISFVAVVLWGRCLYESKREFSRGQVELAFGNTEEAILHYDRSLHWFAPLNPFPGQALKQLLEISEKYTASDQHMALLALDSARGGIRAVRSFYQPYAEWVERIDSQIATLRAKEEVQAHPDRKYDEILAWHQKTLKKDERPKPLWVLIVQIGFWGWLGSTLGLIWKGFDREGVMHLIPSIRWMVAMVVFFAMWVMGLVRA